jgi:hypothetical protein
MLKRRHSQVDLGEFSTRSNPPVSKPATSQGHSTSAASEARWHSIPPSPPPHSNGMRGRQDGPQLQREPETGRPLQQGNRKVRDCFRLRAFPLTATPGLRKHSAVHDVLRTASARDRARSVLNAATPPSTTRTRGRLLLLLPRPKRETERILSSPRNSTLD